MKLINLTVLLSTFFVFIISCSSSEQATKKNKIIVDVRTPEEWNSEGHASCSVNYPLDILTSKFEKLKMYDTIYVVCRSGNRASIAKEMLELEGIAIVENKGAWQNIHCQ